MNWNEMITFIFELHKEQKHYAKQYIDLNGGLEAKEFNF